MNAVNTNKSRDDINVKTNDNIWPIIELDNEIPRSSLVATSPDDLCAKKLSCDENSFINKFAEILFESLYCSLLNISLVSVEKIASITTDINDIQNIGKPKYACPSDKKPFANCAADPAITS